jgi:NuA3 HAT complex component NTO1
MIQLETKEWVHHVCVNWHNEIWFEKEDVSLMMFSGRLNLRRFEHLCSLCNIKEGSCIDCDLPSCKTRFHVRCAIEAGLIMSNEDETIQE